MPRYKLAPPPASMTVIQELREAAEDIAINDERVTYVRMLTPAEAHVLANLLRYLESVAWMHSLSELEIKTIDVPTPLTNRRGDWR